MKIKHREFVTDIYSAPTLNGTVTSFLVRKFSINPGLVGSFPWGSTIANNFVHYHIKNIEFTYVSQSASALDSTNTALGKVLFRYQYDPTFPIDSSVLQMQNSSGCHTIAPYHALKYPITVGGGSYPRTVRSGPRPAGTDLRMYDYGYLEVATQGQQAVSTNLGSLWVTYDIDYLEANYVQGLVGNTLLTAHLRTAVADFTTALPLGATAAGAPLPVLNNNLDVLIDTATGTVSLPEFVETGRFMVYIRWGGANTAAITLPGLSFANAAYINDVFEGTNLSSEYAMVPFDAGTSGWMSAQFIFEVTAPGNLIASFTMDGTGNLPTGPRTLEMWVLQYNGTMR